MSNEYKLVPVVPTEAMVKVGNDLINAANGNASHWNVEKLYAAMLATSPAHDGEAIYQWKRHADTAWNDSDKEECEKVALIDFLETRILYTAPPRVVDVDAARLAEIIQEYTGCADSDACHAAMAVQISLEQTK